jgi:uncharacterized damage-inducible protein DinB
MIPATTRALAGPARHPAHALRDRLDELMRLVMTLPIEVYGARTTRVSGAIGEHVRHALDHVAALVAAPPSTVLSYDGRTRGTAIESDPAAAVREIMRLDAALQRWSHRSLEEPVAVTAIMSPDGQTVTGWSSLGRELAFVLSHTIHHQAIVALLLEGQGCRLTDDRFGVAPSTPTRA